MGQYYKPINIDKGQWLYSHDYNNGLKLMEHSYLGNDFVWEVMNLLLPEGDWYKDRIVWAGDYYGPEMMRTGDGKYIPDPEKDNGEIDYFGMHEMDEQKINPKTPMPSKADLYKFVLLNHTKKLYFRFDKVKPDKGKCGTGWKINPLPLLTCLGNGRGGGDYDGSCMDAVGSWAGDSLSMLRTYENMLINYSDYKEFYCHFSEGSDECHTKTYIFDKDGNDVEPEQSDSHLF